MNRYAVIMGDTNVDMVILLPDRTRQPLDLSRSVPQLSGGGTGGNTTAALARLGVPVSFVGSVGDDTFGRWLVEDMQRGGIDLRGLRTVTEEFTVQVIVLVEPDGERLLVVYPQEGGAHRLLRTQDLNSELMKGAAWLHTTGICLRPGPMRETTLFAMRQAQAAGIPVSFDLNLRLELWGWGNGFKEAVVAAIEHADVVMGSGHEEILETAKKLYGVETPSPEIAAQTLSQNKRTVIARLGARGAMAATPEGTLRVPAFPTPVINSVGAGDAFDAGFIQARLQGGDLEDALRRGNAVASLKIRRSGSRDLPESREVDALLGQV